MALDRQSAAWERQRQMAAWERQQLEGDRQQSRKNGSLESEQASWPHLPSNLGPAIYFLRASLSPPVEWKPFPLHGITERCAGEARPRTSCLVRGLARQKSSAGHVACDIETSQWGGHLLGEACLLNWPLGRKVKKIPNSPDSINISGCFWPQSF